MLDKIDAQAERIAELERQRGDIIEATAQRVSDLVDQLDAALAVVDEMEGLHGLYATYARRLREALEGEK